MPEVWVDDDWIGSSPGDVVGGTHIFGNDAFATINDAKGAVIEGGTVNVAAGIYPEIININKSMRLLGAQANVEPVDGGRTGGESIIQAGNAPSITPPAGEYHSYNGFVISASDVEINGFACLGSSKRGIADAGVSNGTVRENVKINYNWIDTDIAESGYSGIIFGLNVSNFATGVVFNDFEISHNLIFNGGAKAIAPAGGIVYNGLNITYNNISCTGTVNPGRGIFAGGLPTGNMRFNNAVISNNNFHDITDLGINMVNNSNLTLSNNTFTNVGAGVYLATDGGTISGNTISGLTGAGYGFKLTSQPGWTPAVTQGVSITGNSITYTDASVGLIVDVYDVSTQVVDAASLSVQSNSFLNTTGSGGLAIQNLASTTLPATCNWFGTADATEVTAVVSGDVTYAPFSISEGGACTGVLPIVTNIGPASSTTCGTLDVPVTVQDFNNVANVSLTLIYDNSVLEYQSETVIATQLTGYSATDFDGEFVFARNSLDNEVTLADNTVLFILHFNIRPAAVGGSTTDLTWSTVPGICEYSGAGLDPLVYAGIFNPLTVTIPNWLVTNTSTNLSYCTIQEAIDANETGNGHTIEVAAGTFNENIVIDKDITLLGANAGIGCDGRDAESIIAGAGGAAVTVASDGVTIDGFEITNPTGSNAISSTSRNNLLIQNNNINDIGTSGTPGNVHAVVFVMGATDADNVDVVNNCFSNINNVSNNGSGSAVGVGWSTATTSLANLNISYNTISNVNSKPDVTGGKGAYGIMLNVGATSSGEITSAIVDHNTIYSLSGRWSHAIGLEGNTPGAVVQNNLVYSLTSSKDPSDAIGVMIEQNTGVATVAIYENSFSNLAAGVLNATAVQADATCNWYDNVLLKSYGPVTEVPWLASGANNVVSGPGFEPDVDACNSSAPVITGDLDELTVSGCDVSVAPVPVTTVAALEAMGVAIEDDVTADGDLLVTSADVAVGSCPIVITRTYTVTDKSGNASTVLQTINIIHLTIPHEVDGPVATANTVECESAATAPTNFPTVVDMCGGSVDATPGSPIIKEVFTNTFDEAVALSATEADDVWYTDRYAPAGFTSPESFNGDNRLKHSILASQQQPGSFQNTQGREYNVGDNTDYMEIKLYVPASWETANKRLAGFWGVAVDASAAVSGYPIVEFTSDGGTARFRVWESGGSGGWVDLGLPTGFAYDSWVTLKIRLLPSGEFLLTAGDLNYITVTSTADASV